MTADQQAALIEAYHVLFDLWEAEEGKPFLERVDAQAPVNEARSALDQLMRLRGIEVPERYDGDGRTVANRGRAWHQ